MNKLLRSVVLLPLLALSLQACGPKFKEQPSCGFVQNVYGERISWKDSAPVDLLIHRSVPAEMVVAIEDAIQEWENKAGRPLFKIRASNVAGPLEPRQDGVNLIYWMSSWEENKKSEQARTSVYWVGDQIRETDIRINAKDFSFYIDNPTGAHGAVDLQSLMIHELGHVLGLKHKDGSGSVMDTYLQSNTPRNEVSTEDADNLKCEY